MADDEAVPRLQDASESEVVISEILQGHAAASGAYWPNALHDALPSQAFAAELRECAMRIAALDVLPSQVQTLGRRYRNTTWEAVGRFLAEYRQVTTLQQGLGRLGWALDQAELLSRAADYLRDNLDLVSTGPPIKRIFVDAAESMTPGAAEILQILSATATEIIVAGDPDQTIDIFRGVDQHTWDDFPFDNTVILDTSYRMSPSIHTAAATIAAGIPGNPQHRVTPDASTNHPGHVILRINDSPTQQALYIADELRRAHLERHIPWEKMAIILRSPALYQAEFQRACRSLGVPLAAQNSSALRDNLLVASLLDVFSAVIDPATVTGEDVVSLLVSPLIRLDPIKLRHLRQKALAYSSPNGGSPKSADILAALVQGQQDLPPELRAERELQKLKNIIAVARENVLAPVSQALWHVWQVCDIADDLVADSQSMRATADLAHSWLDGVLELFERATELQEQLPGARMGRLLELVRGDSLPSRTTTPRHDAVALISAHHAAGRQWDVVAIAGLQQGIWPDNRPHMSLIDLPGLLDAIHGIGADIGSRNRTLDEIRLFYVAMTRAKEQLIVTAIADEENIPSRLIYALAGNAQIPTGWPHTSTRYPRRTLNFAALVAELRTVACQDDASERETAAATSLLAKLARAGVGSADPHRWFGLAPISTDQPRYDTSTVLPISVSDIETLTECPLRGVLTRSGGARPANIASRVGTVIHAIADGLAAGVSSADLAAEIADFATKQEDLPLWERRRLHRQMDTMFAALQTWQAQHQRHYLVRGSEVPISVLLRHMDQSIQLRGRIDWLAADEQGHLRITDFKSGQPISRAAAEDNAQLAAYQLAVIHGAADRADPDHLAESAGAELVYLSSGKPAIRQQSPLTNPREWEETIKQVASESNGPRLIARTGSWCRTCPVRSSCPAQMEGRQVGQE